MKLLTFLDDENDWFCKLLVLLKFQWNRTQEADGSIPFISTIIGEFGSRPPAVVESLNSGALRGLSRSWGKQRFSAAHAQAPRAEIPRE